MPTQTRKLKGLIKPNAKIKRLIDYPPAVWLAMAEDFSLAGEGIDVENEYGRLLNHCGICWYLERISGSESLSYDLVYKESDCREYPFDDNDERVLFCLIMYQATKAN